MVLHLLPKQQVLLKRIHIQSPGTYTVSLEVETASGCRSAVYKESITVFPVPVASFTFGKGCLPNAAISFTNNSLTNGAGGGLNYLWNFGDGGTASIANPAHTYSSPGPFNVTLKTTSGEGCADDTVIVVNSIHPQPKAAFTIASEVCQGSVLSIKDGSSVQNGSIISWLWSFDDGTTSTVQNPDKIFTTAGQHSFTLRVTSAEGCVSELTAGNVTVNPLPVSRYLVTSTSCETQSITFSDGSSIQNGIIAKWKWNMGDGTATVEKTPPFNYTYNAAGSYNITLQTESAKGCVSPVFDSAIVVNALPQVIFGMPENCLNDPLSQFSDSTVVANGTITNWLWNFGDPAATGANPNVSTSRDGAHKYSQARSYDVSLKATSDKGCSASITKTFTVNGAVPESRFAVNGGNTQCSNNNVTITNNSGVDVGNIIKLEIFWDASDPSNKLTDETPEPGKTYSFLYPEFFSPQTKSYTIRIRAYSGVQCFDDTSVTIQVAATPEIVFVAPLNVCADSAAFNLNASVTNIPGNGIYSGTGVNEAGLFSPQSAGAGAHEVRYTFTGANGCVNYKEQTIKVNPVPIISAGPETPLGVLEGGSVTIPATATGVGLSYLWSPATGLNNVSVLRPVASPLEDTRYRLTATSSDGCAAWDEVFVKVLRNISVPNVFSPNGDGVHDKWEITYLESYQGAIVQIYNRYGQLVFTSKGYAKSWDGTLNGKPLPVGTYYYVIDPKNGRKPVTGFVDIIR